MDKRVAAIGVDKVMQIWETMNDCYPFFAVWFNRNNKYFQYNKDDLEAARIFLLANLEAMADGGDNTMYYLNIYSEPKVKYSNSDMIASFPFRLNEADSSSVAGVPGQAQSFGEFAKLMQESNARHIELIKEIAELKNANQPLDWYDRVTGILETPGAANMIVPILQPVIAAITGILAKVSGIPTQSAVPQYSEMQPGIAGADVDGSALDEKLDAQLDRLEKHGDLLEMLTALADFADKSPDAFNGYLKMLMAK